MPRLRFLLVLLATIATRAPARSSACAAAAPIPRDDPVTSAVRPSSGRSLIPRAYGTSPWWAAASRNADAEGRLAVSFW